MNHPLIYLPSVDNTNTWAKEHLDRFGALGAVYSTSQTAGLNQWSAAAAVVSHLRGTSRRLQWVSSWISA